MTQSLIQHEEAALSLLECPHVPASFQKCTERLRILHVIPQLRPGGTEYALLRLIRGLGKENFEHRICATRGMDMDFAVNQGVADRVVLAGEAGANFQFPFFRLARVMRSFQPHIVHSRNWGGIEAVAAARYASVPVTVHSEHGYELDSLAGLPLRRRFFRRAAYAMADAVFANSRELRDYHARQVWNDPSSIRVLYNGVDTARFAPQSTVRQRVRQELNLPSSSIVLGNVGRLVKIKDHATLLKAAALLLHRGVDVRVLLVGAGPEMAALQQQVKETEGLSDRVVFVGACERIPEMLNAMDIFVLSSLGEGMSNTLLEAMACALPVVATRVGGNPELVEENLTGYLFSPEDVDGLASILERHLCDETTRRCLGAAARERAALQFSLDRMVAEYHNLYIELAARRGITAVARLS